MTLVYADRVQETFTTTGTGTVSLAGPVVGYQSFGSTLADTNTCYYTATDGTKWETGLATYAAAGNTLARTTIYESSNGNSAVNWASGNKNIWLDLPAHAIATFVPNTVAIAAGNIYSGSQTWDAPDDTTSSTVFKCTLVAPGGGGGGNSNASGSAGAGGGGGTCILYVSSLVASTGYSYTEGAIGTGGASGANNGTAGGNSTFVVGGVTMTANGGGAGIHLGLGGAGGTASNGTINIPGQNGGSGSTFNNNAPGGTGGNTILGFGGTSQFTADATVGAGYGSGGGGGFDNGAHAGGNGAPGCLIIERISG